MQKNLFVTFLKYKLEDKCNKLFIRWQKTMAEEKN